MKKSKLSILSGGKDENKPDLITTPRDFFSEVLNEGVEECKLSCSISVKNYLINLLEHYMHTDNLFIEEETGKKKRESLAELYLKAGSQGSPANRETYKRLGDLSLYISGFFGDSLKRKVVDVDYYAELGGASYGVLAATSSDNELHGVFSEFSKKFLGYVEVLTFVSQKAFFVNEEDLLRLYDRYILTGSKVAEDQLLEKGLITPTPYAKKVLRQ